MSTLHVWLEHASASSKRHPLRVTAEITLTITVLALVLTFTSFELYGERLGIPGFLVVNTVAACLLLAPTFAYPWVRLASRLNGLQIELEKLVNADPLTGILNRRGFLSQSAALEWRPDEHCRAVISIDVDRFKEINDQFGHEAGDAVLCAIARCISETLGKTCSGRSLVGRIGGDEFAAIVSLAAPKPLDYIGEHLRRAIAKIPIAEASEFAQVSASIGIALWKPEDSLAPALKSADEAAYEIKRSGRNAWKLAS
jgi:diguanylate cyclase (GGDEF)-like protein